MKYVFQAVVMSVDLFMFVVMYRLLTERPYLLLVAVMFVWFAAGGFDAWRPSVARQFIRNWDRL